MKKTSLAILIGFLFLCTRSFAGDWPNWRGPKYNGTSEEANLPDKLDPEKNLLWSVSLPGPAASTPVIAAGKIFMTSTDKDSKDLLAVCIDTRNVKALGIKKITEAQDAIPLNTLASCSPVTDPEHVYFLYGEGTAACLNQAGQIVWKRNLVAEYGPLALKFGYSSSPLLYDNKLYIFVLRREKSYRGPQRTGLDSFLLALDSRTGQTFFKQQRTTDALDETTNSYATPLPVKFGDQTQIIVYGADYLTGHDAQTGRELWRYQYDTTKDKMNRIVTTPLAENGILYCVTSRGKRTFAFSYQKFMDTKDPLLWEKEEPGPDVSCPVLYKGSLYTLDDRGEKTLSCLDPATGTARWTGQVDQSGVYYASLTAADDKLYMINEKGVLSIVAADPGEFKLLSVLELGEDPVYSSVAIADGKVYVRTAETLYCFGK